MKNLVKTFNEHINKDLNKYLNEHTSFTSNMKKSRIEGLLNQRLYADMIKNYQEIFKDLEAEGFDKEDIEKFVFTKFKKDVI